MLMLLAATMSKQETIERLTESLEEYKEAMLLQNEENIERAEQHLFLSANLFMMNTISKGDIKNAITHIDEMKEMDRAQSFFKTPKN